VRDKDREKRSQDLEGPYIIEGAVILRSHPRILRRDMACWGLHYREVCWSGWKLDWGPEGRDGQRESGEEQGL
jgi:hypothetical protein